MLKKCHALKGSKAHKNGATTTYAGFSHPQPAAWCGERGTPVFMTSHHTGQQLPQTARVRQAGLDAMHGLAFYEGNRADEEWV